MEKLLNIKTLTITPIDKTFFNNGVIAPVDLTNVFKNIILTHNIYDVSNSGSITILDEENLISNLPIIGGERLDIEFDITTDVNKTVLFDKDGCGVYKRVFFVYSIDNIKHSNISTLKEYTILFTSLPMLLNITDRLEMRYKGTLPEIVKKVFNVECFKYSVGEYNKEKGGWKTKPYIKSDESCAVLDENSTVPPYISNLSDDCKLDYVCPAWRPFSFIQKLCRKTNTKWCDFGDVILFQQVDGKYNLTSYTNIFSKNNKEHNFVIYPIQEIPYNELSEEALEIYIVNNFSSNNIFDIIEETNNGMHGFTSNIFDLSKSLIKTYPGLQTKDGRAGYAKNDTLIMSDNDEEEPLYFNGQLGDINPTKYNYKCARESSFAILFNTATGINQSSLSEDNIALRGAKNEYATGYPLRYAIGKNVLYLELENCCGLRLGSKVEFKDVNNSQTDNTFVFVGTWFITGIRYELTRDLKLKTKVELKTYSAMEGKV